MGVDNKRSQGLDCLHRVISRDHDKVCRIKIYPDAGGTQAVDEFTQHNCCFRACFNRKVGTQLIAEFSQLYAGILEHLVTGMVFIRGNNTDMGGDNIGVQIPGQLHDPFGFFDTHDVIGCITKAMTTQITAQGRDHQAVAFDFVEQFTPLLLVQVFRADFTCGGIDLDTVRTDLPGLAQPGI